MTQEAVKIKNGMLTLPRTLRRYWKDSDVFTRASRDTLVIKKVQPSSFWNTWRKMKKIDTSTSQKDIETAISWARRQGKK